MRTKSRSRREQVAASVCAVVLLAAISALALTRSTTPTAPSAPVADAIIPPENEAAEMALGTDPNALLDIKQGSNQDVTVAQVRQMQAQAAQVEAAASGIAWKQLGPYNIGGRLTDVVADVDQPNTVVLRGRRRRHLALDGRRRELDQRAGRTRTRSRWARSSGRGRDAVGRHRRGQPARRRPDLLRRRHLQVDGRGATWTNTGLRDSEAIGRIASDPTNPNRVFAAASGHIARSSGERGLYRTEDAGQTWKLVLPPPNALDRRDRRRDPPDEPADRLRVAVGPPAHQRPPHLRRRRLRPVPLDGRRRHVDAAREHRRPALARPTTRRRRA